jgi:predicted DNA-binding transcriptional regulator AlpA
MSLEHSPQRQRSAYSVAEFCEAYGLSVPMFYKLRGRGEAPDVMKIGSRTLISVEAAMRWVRARERATRQLKQTGS